MPEPPPMLREWLGPTPVDEFARTHLQKLPCAAAGTTGSAVALGDWDMLGRVLAAGPDVLVVARGSLLEVAPPRDLAELGVLMAAGVGLCVRHAERCDPVLASLAGAFAGDLPGEVQVQLFVTPGGTHGFGWHFDGEDVFIAQTIGVKDYFFRANSVASEGPVRDFHRIEGEVTQLCTARLEPGDFLYIPTRWWHMAKCLRDSLSISLGVFPRLH
jgi:50S ribosomal protein L16 3-hydroxylase